MYVSNTASTNSLLAEQARIGIASDGDCIYTFEQNAGRGQKGNTWESQTDMNLLLSTLIVPHELHIAEQFVLSEIVALAAQRTLSYYTDDIYIKWPNDIYWHNKKIAGILIENTVVGPHIKHSIAGIGININQTAWSDALPNPISLKQITGKDHQKEEILERFMNELETLKQQIDRSTELHEAYCSHLYRATGFHSYRSQRGEFMAEITHIAPDGQLTLRKEDGSSEEFYFKEVEFVV